MAQFKKGDRVRIRPDTSSQFRGHNGTVTEEPISASGILGYIVEIDYRGLKLSYQFSEKELEVTPDK